MSVVQSKATSTRLLPILAEVLCEQEGPFTVTEIVEEVERRKGEAFKEGEDIFLIVTINSLHTLQQPLISVAVHTYEILKDHKEQIEEWLLERERSIDFPQKERAR